MLTIQSKISLWSSSSWAVLLVFIIAFWSCGFTLDLNTCSIGALSSILSIYMWAKRIHKCFRVAVVVLEADFKALSCCWIPRQAAWKSISLAAGRLGISLLELWVKLRYRMDRRIRTCKNWTSALPKAWLKLEKCLISPRVFNCTNRTWDPEQSFEVRRLPYYLIKEEDW